MTESIGDEAAALHGERLAQRRDLRAILGSGQDGFSVPGVGANASLIAQMDTRFSGPYSDLGASLQLGFIERARERGDARLIALAGSDGILFGARVLCQLLRYGPPAYRAYTAAHPEMAQSSLDESVATLGAIMLRSAQIVRVFAGVTLTDNNILEKHFGLRGDPPLHEDIPFVIAPRRNGVPQFKPSPITKWHTDKTVADRRKHDPDVVRDGQPIRCPSTGQSYERLLANRQ